MAAWLDKVSDAVPMKWKVIALIGGLLFFALGISGSFVYIYEQGKDHGELKERNANKDAQNAALEKALKDRDDALAQLQEYEDEIYNQPETDDGPLSPGLARTLDANGL